MAVSKIILKILNDFFHRWFLLFVGIFVPEDILFINRMKIDSKFLLSRASFNAYRNFGLGKGYRLGGDPLGGLDLLCQPFII
jgi:hypothetical protein